MLKRYKLKLYFAAILFLSPVLNAQTFTRITDPSNVIAADSTPRNYVGTSWIDYNNDGLLDLFVNNDYLYKNEGNGNFSRNLTFKGRTQSLIPMQVISSGNSWADYDNDGDLDMFSASAKSFLFRNDGDENFTRITSGAIADSVGNRGWTCTWGDYDNDGNVDLLIVHPANFIPGTPLPNLLFHNDGPPDYTFTKVSGFHFTTQLAPYTVATWSDYDLDGDIDLFIGSGPANGTPARDYLYKNMLKETNAIAFDRITETPIGTDLQDGQVWNLIDYDNDGDFDAFLTNYASAPNRLYRNNDGIYLPITSGMELNGVACLANTWGDFDNDGFLDVVITSETKNYFYHNNGDGTFSSAANAITINGGERGASIGDYDNDGDLDIFIAGAPNARGLFRNENQNGNNWKKLKLVGTKSNRAAIGAVVRLKASLNGIEMWQLREISGQNSFNSQNSLIVHFGLSSAASIDSIIINWPSGEVQMLTNLSINTEEVITEPSATSVDDHENNSISSYSLEQNYPNPFNPATKIKYSIPFAEINRDASLQKEILKIYDILGNEITTLVNIDQAPGEYEVEFDGSKLSSGVYLYKLEAGSFRGIKKMILNK